ncbi:Hypothetical predicted protein [Olea europaea subsp. europaea]|uniref:Uncharacterized protein n=1 Tax=Olea europaea subsp. europaea TaxID=158383 RepID=A0A8S0QNY5_OLEEU|nr:Hypothetical predicted protein [Olea europaea subsp. europaea]
MRAKIAKKKLFVIDESTRSSHSNDNRVFELPDSYKLKIMTRNSGSKIIVNVQKPFCPLPRQRSCDSHVTNSTGENNKIAARVKRDLKGDAIYTEEDQRWQSGIPHFAVGVVLIFV